jgi:2-C-methyl-D-erythritol 4-phosphate cytidylyltransferase
MNKYVIVVAGGSGTRMGAPISKQYLPIGGKTILMHTLEVFYTTVSDAQLILVIPAQDFELWDKLCHEYEFKIPHVLVEGGKSRFQSVRNGLNSIHSKNGVVAIHDGVRPFVSPKVITESFEVASKLGSAIAVVTMKDSIRKVDKEGRSNFEDRAGFRLVQTPQTFDLGKIKTAFEVPELSSFTDDATVYEYTGMQVQLIEGNYENIKITTPEDLKFAEFLLLKG